MVKSTTTKIDTVRTLLAATDGVSLDALSAATGWQPHSVRAALSGLRKAGHAIARFPSDDGHGSASLYRIAASPEAAA